MSKHHAKDNKKHSKFCDILYERDNSSPQWIIKLELLAVYKPILVDKIQTEVD